MVNINDLYKVRQTTKIYSQYKKEFDLIREVGIRAEAALKIIIGDIKKLTLGDDIIPTVIYQYNITKGEELVKIVESLAECRNYSSHNDIKMVRNNIYNIEKKLNDDCNKSIKSLNAVYEYMFVIYFSKGNYANNLETLGLFSLLPPFFRHNVLEKYHDNLIETIKGYKTLLKIMEEQKSSSKADFNPHLKYAINDILYQLSNIYRDFSCFNCFSNAKSLSLIDAIYSNDFVYSYQKNEMHLVMECFLNRSVYGFYNKFKHLLVFNNKKKLNYKKFKDCKNVFDKEMGERHGYYKQIVLELDGDLKIAVKYLLEFNIIRQRVLLDKLFLAKMKAKGVDVAIEFISNEIDLDEIYDFEKAKHMCKDDKIKKPRFINAKNMKEHFIGKTKRVNNNIQNQDGLPYETFERAKTAFEKHVYDHDLENRDVRYLKLLMEETYDRIISDSEPIKDLSKYFIQI